MPDSNGAIFDWKALPDWGDTIAGFIPPDLQAEVRNQVAAACERLKLRDDVYEFEKLYGDVGDFESLIDRFADQFPRFFPFLRMYHCCRPLNPASYYRAGMLVLDQSSSDRAFAKQYLNNPDFPKVTETELSAGAASLVGSYQRDGWIYFGLDDRFLVESCPHYLTHGSEYLQRLAEELTKRTGYDIMSDLARRGRPTVFAVRMPAERIENDLLQALGRKAFYAWAYGLAHDTRETWKVDFGVGTTNALPAECIIEHYFPPGIS